MDNKNNSGKKVLSNTVIYAVTGLLQKCFSFFLLPIYTIYLTTEDYGITSISTSFVTTMSFVVSFSLFSAVMRFYVDYKNDEVVLRRFYGSVMLFTLTSGTVFGIILSLFKNVLVNYVFSGIDYFPVIFICLITIIFSCQHTIYDTILRSQQRALKCSVLSIFYFLLNVFLNILFVVVLKKQALGVLLATLISAMLYTIYFFADMIRSKSVEFCLDRKLLSEALKYSIPIIPHNLSTCITELISKALIGGTASLATLGVYSIAAQFGNIADTVQSYVNNAYAPWLYEKLHTRDENYKKTIRSIVNFLVSVIGFFLIGIALFAQDYVFLFLKSSYYNAWLYVPLVVSVFTIKIIYYFYINVLFYYKSASRVVFVATLSSSLVNVLLSAIFIPEYGAYGSILADGIAMFLRVGIVVCISKKYEDTGLKLSDFIMRIFLILLFVFLGMSYSYITRINSFRIMNFSIKIVVLFLYLLIIYVEYRKEINKVVITKIKKWRKSNVKEES